MSIDERLASFAAEMREQEETRESKRNPGPVSSRHRGRGVKTLPVVAAIEDLFHVRYPEMNLSTRQTFYQLAQNYDGVVPKSHRGYRLVRKLLVEMRRSGDLDDDRVVDRTRAVHRLSAWASPAEIMRQVAVQYRRDLWATQSVIPLVGCEKQSLEAIFTEACDEFGAPLLVNRGYSSESYYFDWAKQIQIYAEAGKRTAVKFFADFDPSGCNAEQVLQKHVWRHLEKMGHDPDEVIESWTRVGLTFEDISAPDFFRLPVNRQDKRARRYLGMYGDAVGELDALAPEDLRSLIRGAIVEHVTDWDSWDRLEATETAQRESLTLVADNWDLVLRAAEGSP